MSRMCGVSSPMECGVVVPVTKGAMLFYRSTFSCITVLPLRKMISSLDQERSRYDGLFRKQRITKQRGEEEIRDVSGKDNGDTVTYWIWGLHVKIRSSAVPNKLGFDHPWSHAVSSCWKLLS